ncbi:alcohol dehydrogenase catalytic domain-containing protein [Nocardia sp. ET3-3]|uniref:Alcohol dehydrogenase catalytic domain-containing protein n=1 Tax=Nocardia terrae TaxID=2675851 RepID=A0A7K1V245_9NOCA|nr:NAD(P)-dependent alcohol dehydrogenase [Nocardia terrae]MVU80710.1 alcohol dehydrogenase catalytic domain-containing protein [Nocardia terrae]
MRALAAVLRDRRGGYTIEELTLDEPDVGEVCVRIAGAGLCHTDLLPRAAKDIPLPIVCGHEGSGVVEAVGPGVTDLAIGDHVVLSFDSCGECRSCGAGRPSYCTTFFARNLSGRRVDGSTNARDIAGEQVSTRWFGQSAFATHAVVTAANAVKVDSALPLELLGPLGCGFQTGAGAVLNSLDVQAGSSIMIFGAGAVGLAAIMAARVAGASTIVAVDLNPDRLELAAKYGATHTFDGIIDSLPKQLRQATAGADYALDTTGIPAVIGTAIDALSPLGVCGLLGVQRGDLSINPVQLAMGRTVKGIVEGDAVPHLFIPRLIDLWQRGEFPFTDFIKTYSLGEIGEAEKAVLRGSVVKPVLIP